MSARILLIDDEPQVRTITAACLNREGYDVVAHEVERTERCDDAVREAMDGDYDMLLLDLRLPHLDTLSFLSKLRLRKPRMPVVVIAGYLSGDVRDRLDALSVRESVEKPFTFDCLSRVVRTHLNGHAH